MVVLALAERELRGGAGTRELVHARGFHPCGAAIMSRRAHRSVNLTRKLAISHAFTAAGPNLGCTLSVPPPQHHPARFTSCFGVPSHLRLLAHRLAFSPIRPHFHVYFQWHRHISYCSHFFRCQRGNGPDFSLRRLEYELVMDLQQQSRL